MVVMAMMMMCCSLFLGIHHQLPANHPIRNYIRESHAWMLFCSYYCRHRYNQHHHQRFHHNCCHHLLHPNRVSNIIIIVLLFISQPPFPITSTPNVLKGPQNVRKPRMSENPECPKRGPQICPRHAPDIPQICPRHAPDIPQICPRHAPDIPQTCPRHTQDMEISERTFDMSIALRC